MTELIFEIGHNFNGNMDLAKLMIDEVKVCGGSIAKFQLYDTDKIKKPWQSRYMELKMAELSKEQVKELATYCAEKGIEFMASAFDVERVGWLEEVGVKRHKLASRSIMDADIINAMEATGKPIVVSLGNWDVEKNGFPNIKNAEYLFCVSEYPAYLKADQFPTEFTGPGATVYTLPGDDYAPPQERPTGYSGFSDHTQGCYWAREAVKRGAKLIEKHFTLSHELPGFNQKGSMEPYEAKDLMTYIRQAERGIW
jgi:N,N'-diacetyllegionaminate synthase